MIRPIAIVSASEVTVETTSTFSILVMAAFTLMVIVTGGVLYLTLSEWRDRRRRDRDSRDERVQRR